ncbi:MAG: hydroxyneurosporene dehydrogenase [Isosphaeraceae bacterium]|nr:MAG: hydroxyneurosporene dehydrogenase [Isosphaeraceae bacterium]
MSNHDPDRFFQFEAPGSQEWWYFDALSDDGTDGLVVIVYAALPFDPDYGRATMRHLRDPGRHPAPHPLDHCGIGLSWYHRGTTAAYALNGYRRADFGHTPAPFAVEVAGNRLTRDSEGRYRLVIQTPAVDGRSTIAADLEFVPAAATEPFERNLGTPEAPHHWIVAAGDCRVTGTVVVRGRGRTVRSLDFHGRGYHDHNAGVEEISRAMRRWHWGRVHIEDRTEIYYYAVPHRGPTQSLWLTLRHGRPDVVRESAVFTELPAPRRHRLGFPNDGGLIVASAGEPCLIRSHHHHVDEGPFYGRWISRFRIDTLLEPHPTADPTTGDSVPGISELLETRALHAPWTRWMIPFRFKRPGLRPQQETIDP